jgi:hypothetical protein
MSNSIHCEQLFERFSRFLDREFSQPEKEGEGAWVRVTTAAEKFGPRAAAFRGAGKA